MLVLNQPQSRRRESVAPEWQEKNKSATRSQNIFSDCSYRNSSVPIRQPLGSGWAGTPRHSPSGSSFWPHGQTREAKWVQKGDQSREQTRSWHMGGWLLQSRGLWVCPLPTLLWDPFSLLVLGRGGGCSHMDQSPPETSVAQGGEQISQRERFGHIPSWPQLLQFLHAI